MRIRGSLGSWFRGWFVGIWLLLIRLLRVWLLGFWLLLVRFLGLSPIEFYPAYDLMFGVGGDDVDDLVCELTDSQIVANGEGL